MGRTFAEKVIAKKIGRAVKANEQVILTVDVAMASDTTAPLAIQAFHNMGGERLANPKGTVLILDHATPCPNERIAEIHKLIRDFSREQQNVFYDQNFGVCHQIMMEGGHVKQGDIIIGADSHTCTYGALGAFSSGVGSTDLGAVLRTGKIWLRVPETIQIELTGKLPRGVSAKDIILTIIGKLTADGATYKAIEYTGDGFEALSFDEAATICNMSVEMGAKSGVFVPALTDPTLIPDSDAEYVAKYRFDASQMCPMLSCPHTVDNVATVQECKGTPIDMAYLGSCTNARLSDIKIAADILRGRQIAKNVRMIVAPASAQILKESFAKGYMRSLIDSGATLITPGCGLCVGTLGGVPGDNEVVVSTTNRNFQGRMGNNKADIYLASPATAVYSALNGCISDPREVLI